MEADTQAFVLACTMCARSKASLRTLVWLIHPLPVPGHSWEHIGLDFVTGLPPSEGNTVILTIVDHFSRVAHFVALSKLNSARETAADVLVHHVVRQRV